MIPPLAESTSSRLSPTRRSRPRCRLPSISSCNASQLLSTRLLTTWITRNGLPEAAGWQMRPRNWSTSPTSANRRGGAQRRRGQGGVGQRRGGREGQNRAKAQWGGRKGGVCKGLPVRARLQRPAGHRRVQDLTDAKVLGQSLPMGKPPLRDRGGLHRCTHPQGARIQPGGLGRQLAPGLCWSRAQGHAVVGAVALGQQALWGGGRLGLVTGGRPDGAAVGLCSQGGCHQRDARCQAPRLGLIREGYVPGVNTLESAARKRPVLHTKIHRLMSGAAHRSACHPIAAWL